MSWMRGLVRRLPLESRIAACSKEWNTKHVLQNNRCSVNCASCQTRRHLCCQVWGEPRLTRATCTLSVLKARQVKGPRRHRCPRGQFGRRRPRAGGLGRKPVYEFPPTAHSHRAVHPGPLARGQSSWEYDSLGGLRQMFNKNWSQFLLKFLVCLIIKF